MNEGRVQQEPAFAKCKGGLFLVFLLFSQFNDATVWTTHDEDAALTRYAKRELAAL